MRADRRLQAYNKRVRSSERGGGPHPCGLFLIVTQIVCGAVREPASMFSFVSPEQRIPRTRPLRAIRALVDEVLADMSRELDRLYATIGRPSIPASVCCAAIATGLL